eukprot:SAG11_NODE_3358_length_2500_cov_2.020400_1_plen_52_part_00
MLSLSLRFVCGSERVVSTPLVAGAALCVALPGGAARCPDYLRVVPGRVVLS